MNRQYPLPLPYIETMAADDFMITGSNREAAMWINRWPEWPTHCLIFYGPSGSGKTHLAQIWKTRSGAKDLAISGLSKQSREDAAGAFLIENAHKIANIPAHEEVLFHLYNRMHESKNFLLLTSLTSPVQWNIGLADLRSRLLSVPAIGIAVPDDELISAMLIKQFRDRQIDIGSEVLDYLLPRVERSPQAIRVLVETLDQVSLAQGRRITVGLARGVLEDQGFPI